jgi:hypothetical protein
LLSWLRCPGVRRVWDAKNCTGGVAPSAPDGSDRVNELHLPPNVFFEVQREGVDRWKAVISYFRMLIAAAVARSP